MTHFGFDATIGQDQLVLFKASGSRKNDKLPSVFLHSQQIRLTCIPLQVISKNLANVRHHPGSSYYDPQDPCMVYLPTFG